MVMDLSDSTKRPEKKFDSSRVFLILEIIFLFNITEATVESIFGIKAGIVWEALNQNGPSSIDNIVKATGLRRELVYGALGWLGRENKIIVERRDRALVFSLNP